MKTLAFRLHPGQDLKQGIIDRCRQEGVSAGAIVTLVGSLRYAVIRMADADMVREYDRDMEIVSFEGTVCRDGGHFHISLSDRQGRTIGGHLMDGCLINTTAEVVIADLSDEYDFRRIFDEDTGYDELVVKRK